MTRTTRRWVTGAALSAGVLMVGAAPVLAQTDDTPPSTPDAPADTPTEVPADEPTGPPAWITSILDQLVASGTITQAQADAVSSAIQEARPERGEGRPGPGRFGVALDAAAEALGIDLDELRAELRDGTTIAELATEHGVDVQQVIDALTAAAKARLDEAVAAGRLTQEEADSRLEAATTRIQEMVDEPLPAFGDHHGGPGRGGRGGPGHGTDDGTTGDSGTDGSTPSTPSTVPPTTGGS